MRPVTVPRVTSSSRVMSSRWRRFLVATSVLAAVGCTSTAGSDATGPVSAKAPPPPSNDQPPREPDPMFDDVPTLLAEMRPGTDLVNTRWGARDRGLPWAEIAFTNHSVTFVHWDTRVETRPASLDGAHPLCFPNRNCVVYVEGADARVQTFRFDEGMLRLSECFTPRTDTEAERRSSARAFYDESGDQLWFAVAPLFCRYAAASGYTRLPWPRPTPALTASP